MGAIRNIVFITDWTTSRVAVSELLFSQLVNSMTCGQDIKQMLFTKHCNNCFYCAYVSMYAGLSKDNSVVTWGPLTLNVVGHQVLCNRIIVIPYQV